ncbi:hypothetical protein BDW02DRAFT_564975 [Decorospora gaudefroyi]|uniref:Secreted protein n=1 Tax=Decorospora gaudefroyi TaxID=184978 RepID=A0A6A5KJ21_9PLEO|nr:hypothetical protein BDW02DRAFT_564975 [Decorospora gaudefroyi]
MLLLRLIELLLTPHPPQAFLVLLLKWPELVLPLSPIIHTESVHTYDQVTRFNGRSFSFIFQPLPFFDLLLFSFRVPRIRFLAVKEVDV